MNLALTILYTVMMLSLSVSLLLAKQFRDRSLRPVIVLGAMGLTYGILGWCACLLSTGGAFDGFPPTFEYPIWRTTGAVTLVDGTHVVPHLPSSRIQIYDRDWHYVRGWRIPSGGGSFRLIESSKDQIEVFIERGDGLATYARTGSLLGLEWDAPRPSKERSRERLTVPTPLLLRSFSSMELSWLIAAAGAALLYLCHASVQRDEEAEQAHAIMSHIGDLDDVAPEPRRDLV